MSKIALTLNVVDLERSQRLAAKMERILERLPSGLWDATTKYSYFKCMQTLDIEARRWREDPVQEIFH
jgi:hypothetical protein